MSVNIFPHAPYDMVGWHTRRGVQYGEDSLCFHHDNFFIKLCCFDRDVAAIALANASMGDYKLKSSPDYEVRSI